MADGFGFLGTGQEEVIERGKRFATIVGRPQEEELFVKSALLARDPLRKCHWTCSPDDNDCTRRLTGPIGLTVYETLPLLTEEDRRDIHREETHRWDHPRQLYMLVICCSLGAVVQGMDQSVINGANLFFPKTFGIEGESNWFLGIINSAPYFSCALLACFVTEPLNHFFGRRGTIFITCFVAFVTCVCLTKRVCHVSFGLAQFLLFSSFEDLVRCRSHMVASDHCPCMPWFRNRTKGTRSHLCCCSTTSLLTASSSSHSRQQFPSMRVNACRRRSAEAW